MPGWKIEEGSAGVRLDVFLAEVVDLTRSRTEKLIRDGRAEVDGKRVTKPGTTLKAGQWVELQIPEVKSVELMPQDLPIRVIYQDSDLAVVYKPSGMVVHPAAGNPDGTMVNALMMKLDGLSGIGGEMRPGIVHRIDKDTSGLLFVAKNDKSHLFLSEQIKEHTVQRAYLSILIGRLKEPEGDVHGPIGRHPVDRKKMAIVPNGKEAHTHYRVLEELRGATLIEARLTTGRTHQIRVHMASLGHPVLGDPVYGPKKSPYPVEGGQLLHAFRLGFIHPTTGETMLFEAPPEDRFEYWRKKLKQ
ncbi:MAG: RluA family pseudouridine synthase [Clostridia bacterium]|nr:RluA family pseudouridine synthase [Clostridia bacterium]